MTKEQPKRKAHTKEVLRELFAKSGNMCAWPQCSHIIINDRGRLVGQICHIEGVKGERFREGMTNEERAAVSNLILLCYKHHVETDDESKWTVERLRTMKKEHEKFFTEPELMLYKAYVDGTKRSPLRLVSNARRFANIIGWPNSPLELQDTADEINAIFKNVERLDFKSRRFLSAVVTRAWLVRDTPNVIVRNGHLLLRWEDFVETHDVSETEMKKRIEALGAHQLGTYNDDWMEVSDSVVLAIQLYRAPNAQCDFWLPIAEFCEKAGESLENVITNLDLSIFD